MKTISSIFIYLGFCMVVVTAIWKFVVEWNGYLALSAVGCLFVSVMAEVRAETMKRKRLKRRIRL